MSAHTRRLLYLQLFWLAPGLVGTVAMVRLELWQRAVVQLVMWMSWSVPTIVVFLLADRWPLTREHWLRSLLLVVVLGAIIVPAEVLVTVAMWKQFGIVESSVQSALWRNLRSLGDMYTVIYFGVVVAHAALRWFDEWRAALVVNARLGEDLARAQLDALRAQVNPHFLFNALGTVVALINRDPPAAERTVVALADLLRSTLSLSDRQEIPLNEELEVVRRYVAIEQIRFADRLHVAWDIAPDVQSALVPSLALQPLVENALVHGFGQTTGQGHLTIGARRDNGAVVLTVQDDGPGLSAVTARQGFGIGLGNLRQRLTRLHGDAATLTLDSARGGGCMATLSLPFRMG